MRHAVAPVETDARGIVAPDAGLARFRLDRFSPSPRVGRFVDRYWVVSWDLRGRPSHTQHVLAHPVVNVTFRDGDDGVVAGVTTRVTRRTLTGCGRVLGLMFRPAGFRPLLGRPMSVLADRQCPLSEVVGQEAAAGIARAVGAAPGGAAMAAAADAVLTDVLPTAHQPCEDTTALVDRVARQAAVLRVEDLAAEAGVGTRQLERRFSDHVGLGPKAVIRRYRLYEAAERARSGGRVDWAGIAAELGYSDQSHLTRDFHGRVRAPAGAVRPRQPPAVIRSGPARRRLRGLPARPTPGGTT